MTVSGYETNRALIKATKTVLRRRGLLKSGFELKGSKAMMGLKQDVHDGLSKIESHIYATTFDKHAHQRLVPGRRERVYNFVARTAISKIPIDKETNRISLIVDKSKSKKGVKEFNQYIEDSLEGVIKPGVPLDIAHNDSCRDIGLQIVDLYSWGIFRKYESNDTIWFNTYKHIVAADEFIE